MTENSYPAKRILAIDYGKKRIGIAVSDPLNMFAIALVTLENKSKVFDEIGSIIKSYKIATLVLGLPVRESGERTEMTTIVEKFKEDLEHKFKLPVVLTDERYSSIIALERIRASVPSRKKRRDKSLIDKNAACVILEDYLNI